VWALSALRSYSHYWVYYLGNSHGYTILVSISHFQFHSAGLILQSFFFNKEKKHTHTHTHTQNFKLMLLVNPKALFFCCHFKFIYFFIVFFFVAEIGMTLACLRWQRCDAEASPLKPSTTSVQKWASPWLRLSSTPLCWSPASEKFSTSRRPGDHVAPCISWKTVYISSYLLMIDW
jgi:hypothetical protein